MNKATIDKIRRKIDYVRGDQLFKNAAKANISMVSDSYNGHRNPQIQPSH